MNAYYECTLCGYKSDNRKDFLLEADGYKCMCPECKGIHIVIMELDEYGEQLSAEEGGE